MLIFKRTFRFILSTHITLIHMCDTYAVNKHVVMRGNCLSINVIICIRPLFPPKPFNGSSNHQC